MEERINKEQYEAAFAGDRQDAALEHAMEIRKFEIDLYWKRAAYFWTFIGASFAGYGAVEGASSITSKAALTVPLSCLGLVFSLGWFCVNKGSKLWQENWESHVDLLEDRKIGPLYRIVLMRDKPRTLKGRITDLLTGPAALSVSRINQLISLYVTVVWAILLISALCPSLSTNHGSWCYWIEVTAAMLTCIGFFSFGKTSRGVHRPIAFMRKTEIKDNAEHSVLPPRCMGTESQASPPSASTRTE
jgi:hypothetical protein